MCRNESWQSHKQIALEARLTPFTQESPSSDWVHNYLTVPSEDLHVDVPFLAGETFPTSTIKNKNKNKQNIPTLEQGKKKKLYSLVT